MSLAVCVFITWLVLVVLMLMPKTLTELEMIFLFFICTIFELSGFTLIHLNMHWLHVSESVEKSFADLVMRLVCIPLLLVIASNVVLYSSRILGLGLIVAIVLLSMVLQKTIVWLGILTTPHWNVGLTALMFCCHIAFASLMTWFITRVVPREGKVT